MSRKVVDVSTPEVAEACKILENTYRAINIALVNELKILYDRMGIDVWEVIDAAKTKPFGFQAFYPGPGLGGHCIPIDPFYLTWVARKFGLNTRFIELAGEVNHAMPAWVVSKIGEALNDRSKPIRGSKITLLGMAYKKDVDDSRESPGFEILELLYNLSAYPRLAAAARAFKPDVLYERYNLFLLAGLWLRARRGSRMRFIQGDLHDEAVMARVGRVDVALVAVAGSYLSTLNVEQALEHLATYRPDVLIPAHHDEHPFNAPLITDSLLAEAKAVWARPRGRAA